MELFALTHHDNKIFEESVLFVENLSRISFKKKENLKNISNYLPEILFKFSQKLVEIGIDKKSTYSKINSLSLSLYYIFLSPFNVLKLLSNHFTQKFPEKNKQIFDVFEKFSKELSLLNGEEHNFEETINNFIVTLSSVLY